MISENKTEASENAVDIDLDLIGIVKRRFPLILLGLFIGAVGGGLFYLSQVPIYETELVVLVGQRNSELTSTGKGDTERSSSIQEEILSTHMELFTSRKIIGDAIAKSELLTIPSLAMSSSPLKKIITSLKVTKGGAGLAKNASVLKASYKDEDPENAVKILTAIYDSYRRYLDAQSKNVGAEAAELIARAQVKNEEELRKADEEYREFIKSVPALINTQTNGADDLRDVHRIRLAKLETDLANIRSLMAETRARHDVVKAYGAGKKPDAITDIEIMSLLSEKEVSRVSGLFNVLIDDRQSANDQLNAVKSSENVRTEYNRLIELLAKERVLVNDYGDQHPTLRNVRLEIESLKEFLQKQKNDLTEEEKAKRASPAQLLASYFLVLKNEVAELEKREKELVALSEEEAKLAKEVEMKFMLGGSLKSNLQRAQNRYDEVFKRLQEISITNEYVGFSTDLIASPLPNTLAVWPTKTKVGAVGLGLGLLLGLMFALVAEFADRTFRSPEDVEQAVGASILVHIPKIETAKMKRKMDKATKLVPTMATFHAPRGSDAETFRVLRTILLFRANKNNQTVYMITSPSPGDGKSTTISNLAITLAQTGKKILLVDGDLRRPAISKNFGLPKRIGLTDFLTEEVNDLSEICIETEQPNLFICSDGSITSQPSELLESERFREFVDRAREEFDMVLIDAPPLLAVADPAIIASAVDSCLLTLRIEKNNRTLVERAREILADQEADLTGLIVNSRISGAKAYGYSAYNYYGQKEYGYQAKYRRYYAASDPDAERTSKPSRPSREKVESEA
jgi:capsular exopolysaccharide synthesis family protein